jgi:hypothetical protein
MENTQFSHSAPCIQVTSNFGHALSSLTKFFRIAKADPDLNARV